MSIGPVHWMWGALTPLTPPPPPGPPPPARPVPLRNTWPRHATETHRAYQWEIDHLVDGGGGRRESHARPSFPVSIRYTRDGMGIRVKLLGLSNSTLKFHVIFPSSSGIELSLGMTTTLLLYFLSVPSYAATHRSTAGWISDVQWRQLPCPPSLQFLHGMHTRIHTAIHNNL